MENEMIYKDIDSYLRVKRVCLVCKKDFFPTIYAVRKNQGKYCSNTCSKKKLEALGEFIVSSTGKANRAYTKVFCGNCNKEFEALLTKARKRVPLYCSLSCRSIATVPKIKKGLNHHLQVNACNAVKLALIAGTLKRTETCAICGYKESVIDQKRKVEFHHHDYSKPLEVIELCQSCHWKEHYRLGREEITPLKFKD
jgi:hypothetical protein